MNQAFLYDSYRGYYDKAKAAQKEGDNSQAKKYYILAADALEQLARVSEGELKYARKERAKSLLEAAKSLDNVVTIGGGHANDESSENSENFGLNIVTPKDKISFDDIIGLDEPKDAIHRLLINPLKHPDVYRQYGIEPGGYILLEGPPGTGKTTFARAAACEVDLPFIVVNCNDLVDCLVGQTGKNIDKLFNNVRKLIKKNNSPVILFCDEIDAIAKSRGSDDKASEATVPTLISQLDGFNTDNKNLIIIAATNRKDVLDKAFLSRFSRSIFIPLPNEAERLLLLEYMLSKRKQKRIKDSDYSQIELSSIAKVCAGLSGRDIANICDELVMLLCERDAEIVEIADTLTDVLKYFAQKKLKESGNK